MSRLPAVSRVAALLWIAVLTAPATAQQPAVPEGPIAFISHGAMFDRDGREITPTPEFVAEALAFYREALLGLAAEPARAGFAALEAEVATAPQAQVPAVPSSLRARIEATIGSAKAPPSVQATTSAGGEAHTQLCKANGVPVPPDWNTSSWKFRGGSPTSSSAPA